MKAKKVLGCLTLALVGGTLALALLLLLGVWLAGVIGPSVGSRFVTHKSGFPTHIGNDDISLFSGRIDVGDIVVSNPTPRFPEANFVRINKLLVKAEPKALLEDVKVIDYIEVDISHAAYVKNKDRQVNIEVFADAFKTKQEKPAEPKPQEKPPLKYHIKKLILKVGAVRYADYSYAEPRLRDYPLNYSKEFTDVRDPKDIAGILAKDFAGFGMTFMADALADAVFSVETYEQLGSKLRDAGGQVLEAGEKAGQQVGESLKKLFDAF